MVKNSLWVHFLYFIGGYFLLNVELYKFDFSIKIEDESMAKRFVGLRPEIICDGSRAIVSEIMTREMAKGIYSSNDNNYVIDFELDTGYSILMKIPNPIGDNKLGRTIMWCVMNWFFHEGGTFKQFQEWEQPQMRITPQTKTSWDKCKESKNWWFFGGT